MLLVPAAETLHVFSSGGLCLNELCHVSLLLRETLTCNPMAFDRFRPSGEPTFGDRRCRHGWVQLRNLLEKPDSSIAASGDISLIRRLEPSENPCECAFAGAVSPDNPQSIRSLYRKIRGTQQNPGSV